MRARDHRYKKTDYVGHEINCHDELCPCRVCWHIHNCDYKSGDKWIDNFTCITNHSSGCPQPIPKPKHIFKPTKKLAKIIQHIINYKSVAEYQKAMSQPHYFKCIRCGQLIDINHADFKTKGENQ